MNRQRLILLVAGMLLFPAALSAQTADFYVLPVSGHIRGQNDTFWMSDVVIHNFGTTSLEVELVLIRSGVLTAGNLIPIPDAASGATAVTVLPGASRLLSDVLGGLAGTASIFGAILIAGNQPFAVTSRAYSMTPSGNTTGQTVAAASNFLDNTVGVTDHERAVAYVPGIASNARYRTNLGFVAGNASSATEPLVL